MILQADNKEKLNKKDIDSVNSTQLNISGLSVSYSDSTVLENVTLQLKKGEILGIAALTGLGAAISETARLTDEKVEQDEEQLNILNNKFAILRTGN